MVKQTVITGAGLKALEAELDELKSVKRNEIAEKIKIARSFGDLSENSEYDEAKNEQAIIEARIAELEAQLKNVRVLDESELSSNTIYVGSTVKLKHMGTGMEVTYKITGATEADVVNGRISDESPVGAALLGHETGDTVEVEIPNGTVFYTVLEISR
ncbi:MAG: transcription elongation factor GreA [Clostridia bacterium]|nr:transcription elongation factor GreA [Clostridia bacterium]